MPKPVRPTATPREIEHALLKEASIGGVPEFLSRRNVHVVMPPDKMPKGFGAKGEKLAKGPRRKRQGS